MKVTDEMLMALADGELDAETAGILQRRIASDPELQADFALYVQTAAALRDAPLLGPVPERLIRQIRETPVRGDTPLGVMRQTAGRLWRPLLTAASLALAFYAGQFFSDEQSRDSRLQYATLPVGEAVKLPDGSELRAIASYDTAEGFCRHFRQRGETDVHDRLICHGEAGWTERVALHTASGSGSFVTASAFMAETLDTALDSLHAGAALGAAEEALRLNRLLP